MICKCGHEMKKHGLLPGYDKFICLIKGRYTTVEDCSCYQYHPDALRYLEQKYEESVK